MKFGAPLLVLVLLLSAHNSMAQVQVIEAGAVTSSDNPSKSASAGASASTGAIANRSARAAQGELFYQLQLLQDEIMQLRGLVEEQQNSIRRLQQQRLDDYLNLDKRISELTSRPSKAMSASAASTPPQSSGTQPVTLPTEVAGADEVSAYKAAYDLVKAQQFDKAKAAYETFLQMYPTGQYRPNALYWLGELYLLESDLEAARQSFAQLDQYPNHRKVPDALFKLAKVYHLQGNADKAKQLLQQVISTYGAKGHSAATLARDYLAKNFTQ